MQSTVLIYGYVQQREVSSCNLRLRFQQIHVHHQSATLCFGSCQDEQSAAGRVTVGGSAHPVSSIPTRTFCGDHISDCACFLCARFHKLRLHLICSFQLKTMNLHVCCVTLASSAINNPAPVAPTAASCSVFLCYTY